MFAVRQPGIELFSAIAVDERGTSSFRLRSGSRGQSVVVPQKPGSEPGAGFRQPSG